MAISFNNFLDELSGISKSVLDTDAKNLDLAIKQITEAAANVKDINSPEMRGLYKKYQNIKKYFNGTKLSADRKINELKANLESNKTFSSMLTEGGVYSPKKGKDLADYKKRYAEKIAEQESLINNNIDNAIRRIESAFYKSGFTVNEVKTAFKEQDKIISKKITPKLDELDKIKNNIMDLTNQGFEEIDEFTKELEAKLSADDISNAKIKKYTQEFKGWSNDYKKGEVAKGLTEEREKASSIKNTLEKEMSKGYVPDELISRYNEAKEIIDNSYFDIFGEDGKVNEAAFNFHNNRTIAQERITSKNTSSEKVVENVIDNAQESVESQQIAKEVIDESTKAANKKAEESVNANQNAKQDKINSSSKTTINDVIEEAEIETPKLVKGSKVHKIGGDKIDKSTAPKYIVKKNGEDELIAHLKKKGGIEYSPSDYLLGKNNKNSVIIKKPKVNAEEIKNFSAKNLLKKHGLNSAINFVATLNDFKESRREGDGVLKSVAKAGVNFAVGEALGFWGTTAFYAANNLPRLAVKTAENLNKMERQMNSVTRVQPFADAQFQDTQQLATMRQSGMEMAKMAQYNLQQTLMGNEATYMHK